MERKIPLIAVVGNSNTGKTTITRGSSLIEVISYTSRDMREGENEGEDYHFKTKKWMEENKDLFNLDYKEVYDNIYGATDKSLYRDDVIVIYARDAVELKKVMPVHIVWVRRDDIEQRGDRDEPDLSEYIEHVDSIIHNNGSIDDAILRLEMIQSMLDLEAMYKGEV